MPAKTLYVHIGLHKTGTTSIQYALHGATDRLPNAGVIYPMTGRHPRSFVQHAVIANAFNPVPFTGIFALPAQADRHILLPALFHEIELSGSATAVLSSEEFSRFTPDQIAEFGEAFSTFSIQPIAFVRSFPALLEKYHATMIKTGGPAVEPTEDLVITDIASRFEAWARLSPDKRMTVVDYDNSPTGNSVLDFIDILGLDHKIIPSYYRETKLNPTPKNGVRLSDGLRKRMANIYAEQMQALSDAPFVKWIRSA